MSDIDKRLDELATLNKMAHPELGGACYICGINPKLLKQLMVDELEKIIGEDDKYIEGYHTVPQEEINACNELRDKLRQKLKEWKK